MTYSHAKVQGQRSVGSEDRVETSRRTDRQIVKQFGVSVFHCEQNYLTFAHHCSLFIVFLVSLQKERQIVFTRLQDGLRLKRP